MFKKLRGVRIPYERQGEIYFKCRTFAEQDERTQGDILLFCHTSVFGDEVCERALLEFLTEDVSATAVSLKWRVSESQLYRFRRRFFEVYSQSLDMQRKKK